MDLFAPVLLSPLLSTSAVLVALVAGALVITAVLASKHRGHGIGRHR